MPPVVVKDLADPIALQVQAGATRLDARGGDGVHVALAEDQEIIALDLDLVSILRAEEHLVALLGGADVGACADDFAPHQTLLLLRGGGDQDAPAAAPLGFLGGHPDEDPVVEHLDGALLGGRIVGGLGLIGHGRKVPSEAMNAVVGSPTALELSTDDGETLEAQYHVPDDARGTVVLSHPHPQFGGDMHNPLIADLFRALPLTGLAALRYNFRGVGASTGAHGEGVAEQMDTAAAFAAGQDLEIVGPLVSAGWSFGADVSLSVSTPELAAWVAIAAPLRIVEPEEMTAAADPRPTLLLVPEHDQFRSPADAAAITVDWTNSQLDVIAGGDHFLMGRSAGVAESIAAFIATL